MKTAPPLAPAFLRMFAKAAARLASPPRALLPQTGQGMMFPPLLAEKTMETSGSAVAVEASNDVSVKAISNRIKSLIGTSYRVLCFY